MFRSIIGPWLGGLFGPWCIESLGSNLAWEIRGQEHFYGVKGRPHVLVFWHSRMLFMACFFRHRGYHVIVSENVDGEIAARALWPMGIGTIRGSSSRGAQKVLLTAARMLRRGQPVAFTPDGPRGPRHLFQAGALAAARVAGVPILPATASCSHAHVFRSWDRFVLPRGGRAILQFLPPRPAPGRDEFEAERVRIESDLVSATHALDRELGLCIPA